MGHHSHSGPKGPNNGGRRSPPNHNNNHIVVRNGGRTSPTYSSSSSSSSTCGSSGDESAGRLRRSSPLDRRRGLVYTGLFLLCTFVYWNALGCEFVFDDITAIVENRDLRPHVPVRNLFANDFWGTPMSKEQSHKSYRPLTVITFRWNYWLSEVDPLGYHLVNVVLHGLVTMLYFKVCRQLVCSVVSLVASILFALHPVSYIFW
jgi:hypothetical protein